MTTLSTDRGLRKRRQQDLGRMSAQIIEDNIVAFACFLSQSFRQFPVRLVKAPVRMMVILREPCRPAHAAW